MTWLRVRGRARDRSGGLFTAHVELRRGEAGAGDTFGPYAVAVDRKAAERAAEVFERQARIEQRAEDHVAGCAREAVEVQRSSRPKPSYPASLPIRRDARMRPASTREK